MAAGTIEQRAHPRVVFFLVPRERGRLPVWVFKPIDAPDACAGLVLDFSDGGLQVLTGPEDALDAPTYELELLLGEDDPRQRFRGVVGRVWSEAATTIGHLNGLRFEGAPSSAEDFMRAYQSRADGSGWVRCLLRPRAS